MKVTIPKLIESSAAVSRAAGERSTSVTAERASRSASSSNSPAVSSTRHKPVRAQDIDKALAAANEKLAADGHELRFEFDRAARRLVVRLVDVGTREVLRQYPSDEALRMARLAVAGKPFIDLSV